MVTFRQGFYGYQRLPSAELRIHSSSYADVKSERVSWLNYCILCDNFRGKGTHEESATHEAEHSFHDP